MTRETIIKSALLIFLVSASVYSNSLGGQFVYDDDYFIVKNIHIKNLTNIPYFFTNASSVAFSELSQDVYRPLTSVSYAFDYRLWGLDTFGYHIVNVLLHSLSAVAVFAVLILMSANVFTAIVCGLFFACHPVQTEAVAWISGRSSALFLLFYLLSFALYLVFLRSAGKRWIIMSLACYAAALFSKEMAVSLPLLLISFDIHFRRQDSLKKRLLRYAPYFILAVFFISVRFLVLDRVSQCGWWGGSPYRTFLTMAPVAVEYVRLLVLPLKLCAFYVTPIKTSIKDPAVIAALLFIAALLAAAPFIYRRSKRVSFFIWWFIITLLPVSNIVPLRALMAERFLYLPSIGFCALIAILIENLYRRSRAAAAIFAAVIIMLYAAGTMQRNEDWRDSASITRSILKIDPDNPWALTSLGVAYSSEGDYDKAVGPLEKAIAMSDSYFAPKNVLGFCYVQAGRYDDAVAVLTDALRLKPHNIEALNSLGVAYANLGRHDLAVRQFEKAVLADRAYVEGYINLGTAYDRMGQPEKAIEEYKKVESRTNSKHDIAISYIRIGDVHVKLKRIETAREYYRKAMALPGISDELKKVASDRLNAHWDLE